MTALHDLLDRFRTAAATNREAGTYFEDLTAKYLRTDPKYASRYREVVPYAEFAARRGLDKRDAGIDLVAETFTGELDAIQCKLYAADYQLQKSDIDSFFTASGKEIYSGRIIVATTSHWTEHAEQALEGQQPPVTKIDLHALEESPIDWARFAPTEALVLKQKKQLRPHQQNAVNRVLAGLTNHERGKLIMACGTGKTFTSLKIAEQLAGAGKRVLFLVPSLALLSQTLTEWTAESEVPLRCFAVCSDADVGKKKGKRNRDSDAIQTFVHELSYPATTSAERLASEAGRAHVGDAMTVVFSTYHSIDVVSQAQTAHGLPAFDLIVCDEAHRTTGAKFAEEDESHFTKVHDGTFIRARKRLYMTATPRVYANAAKASAEQQSVQLCSMDDEALYGPNLDVLTFSEAVTRGLLVDYKVVVLAVEESLASRRLQGLLADADNSLRMDDAAKIIGCWKALSKQGLHEQLVGDRDPMRRAVAFCQVIDEKPGAKVHKVASKTIAEMFGPVVEEYLRTAEGEEAEERLRTEVRHVDGGMNATEKEDRIEWLKDEAPESTCRILSNVRCLSEGVDVPALDAVLFLTPRNSQIDVVQSVGRVMRNAPGKKRGYVVLPVVIPAGVEPHVALNDNETYRVVWQVLQALRSHDDRFDAMINKLELTGKDPAKMEVIAIVDKVQRPPRAETRGAGKIQRKKREHNIGSADARPSQPPTQRTIEFELGEVERAIYAKLVDKVGNRHHWEDWAKDIADIARRHIVRIQGILDDAGNVREREEFQRFAAELRDDLNDAITDGEIVEMLAQHLVTRPVFDALFAGASFVKDNAVSRAMQGMLELLESHHIDKEAATLEKFYESVKLRASGIESAEGKQKIVVELYDKFFKHAFPRLSERLGIVYTPVEIVDFILHSVADILKEEFGQTLGSPGVHILDPFTGTGTFITRLLSSGLIEKDALARKYKSEIHANELVLLAYYIAAINIESTYHDVMGGEYVPFEGICLTDTFQLYEKDDLISRVLVDNSARRTRQKQLDIRVIVGNPPYSVGQESQNDNNQNVRYPGLDLRIAETYAVRGAATNKTALYDSYVRAIRWASDRIRNQGIVGFVTNANFIEVGPMSGLRKCLVDEFSSLYVFHLRGNQRTAGEVSRREGGKVFGSGSRAPVAISLLVKNPKSKERGRIFFRDIGDHLTREEKLDTVAGFASTGGIAKMQGWRVIVPDEHGDWLRKRDAGFDKHIALEQRADAELALFNAYSSGVQTSRDAWAYGTSRAGVNRQVVDMMSFYNEQLARFNAQHAGLDRKARAARVDGFIDNDPTKISWTRSLKNDLAKSLPLVVDSQRIIQSLYRPFTKRCLYFDRRINEYVFRIPRVFGDGRAQNRAIGVSATESRAGYAVLMTDVVPSLHATDMVGSQYFPLYVYDGEGDPPDDAPQASLFASAKKPSGTARRDGITDAGLAHFASAYPGETLTKEDVFYYVYGILHSPDYRTRYADNLGKELPRIPRVKTAADFWAFSKAGRELGELHVGFEKVPEHAAKIDEKSAVAATERYRVTKMRFGGAGKTKDKSTVVYNEFVTVTGIPLSAYDYVVNGKPAIEWVMERQSVTTDKDSGIVKDANDYANETVGDPRYPLSLLLRVVTVSLETNRIVASLPALEILDEPPAPDDLAARERQIQSLMETDRVAEARALAAGTKWARVFEAPAPRPGAPATGADPAPNLGWIRDEARRRPYAGKWVALRRGEVLASSASLEEVQQRIEAEPDVRDILVDWIAP